MGFFDGLFGGKKQGSQPDEQTRRDLAKGRIESLTNSIGMTLKRIPAGSFVMGASNICDNERPPHKVTIARPFYMGIYPVTQAEWQRVMGDNPSDFKGPNRPVEQGSWKMAQDFCRKLSEKEGMPYRLPTEAQWEYACRAGTTTEYCFGDSEASLGEYAWFEGNSGDQTHDVGQKKPNAWGLFDMHGNVWEWCEDAWHNKYQGAPDDGSAWLTGGDTTDRMLRGGSWERAPWFCRSAARYWDSPRLEWNTRGVRVCLRDF